RARPRPASATPPTTTPVRPSSRATSLLSASFLGLLRRRLLASLVAALTAVWGGARVAAQKSGRQLVDQILQHERILHELDAVALLQEFLGAARRDADVLPAEQARRHDARVAVLRDAVELRVDLHAHDRLVQLLVVADRKSV